jgi:hypothetical protein
MGKKNENFLISVIEAKKFKIFPVGVKEPKFFPFVVFKLPIDHLH